MPQDLQFLAVLQRSVVNLSRQPEGLLTAPRTVENWREIRKGSRRRKRGSSGDVEP